MLNLIFFLPSFTLNGAGNSTFRLCKNLDKKKYKIHVISLGKNFQKFQLKKIGCKVYEINSKNVFKAMFRITPLVKKIYNDKMKKNIFLSSIHHANVFSIIFLRSIKNLKIIGIERTDISELLIYDGLIKYIKNLLIYLLVKIYYKKANIIISNSKSGKKDLEKLCSTRVINISSPSFTKIVHKKTSQKINKLRLIAVGRLAKEKGYKTIIKALSNLNTNFFSMKILGDGPEKNNIYKIIKGHGLEKKIKLLGFKKNTKKYLSRSNLFINASLFEGFPNAVVEAISSGIPVICSNCKGGMSEVLLNGKGGDLFPVHDSSALSKKIMSFYSNPNKLHKKLKLARTKIKKYSISSHVKMYEKVLEII